MNKHFMITLFLLTFFFSTACVFEPWESYVYKKKSKNIISNYDIRKSGKLPDVNKFRYSYINGAFINVSINTKDWGGYERKGPYKIGVTLFTDKNEIEAKINSIEIFSQNKDNIYTHSKGTFPAYFKFDNRQPGYSNLPPNIIEGSFETIDLYNFDFHDKEKIRVKVNISITSEGKMVTKIIENIFKPYTERGLFRFIM